MIIDATLNELYRQLRRKRYELNSTQKLLFEALLTTLPLNPKDKKLMELIRKGIPSQYRVRIWPILLSNPHGITLKLYSLLTAKLHTLKSMLTDPNVSSSLTRSFQLIEQDVPRTFPNLKIFQQDTQYNRKLINILGCFVVFREDIGYLQGMSLIAGMLLLEISQQHIVFELLITIVTADSFYQFLTLNKLSMSKFTHKVGQQLSKEYYKLLKNENIDLMMIITNWMLTLMTRCFELEVLGKIWDMMLLCRMEEEFIVKLCVEVLGQFEEQVVGGDGNGFQVLSKGKLDEIKQEKVVDLMQKYGIQ